MASLRKFLLDKGYVCVPLKRTSTNHFEVQANINGVGGRFILDTGASTSCVDMDNADFFGLKTKPSDIKAAGAGGRGMDTRISKRNRIEIGDWDHSRVPIILFNMIHVNSALIEHNSLPVNGIIGADILKRGKAIIDYDKICVYLKPRRRTAKQIKKDGA